MVLTVTSLILPLAEVTVMPSDGLAFLLPDAGEIFRYLATVAEGMLVTAVELSLVAIGVLPWQAVAGSAAAAVSATAARRRTRRVNGLDGVAWQPYT